MERQFKISVIMPIYNVELYLKEAIDSVVEQTIGFEENIQLILVNDGSPDNCETICLGYRDRFPENVIYIYQKNAGVSAARNKGMEYIQGDFVNFMDPDDKWDQEAFQKFYAFFILHPEVDVVTASMKFFDKQTGYHPLNYRGKKGERVADINCPSEFDSMVMHATSTFFRVDSLKETRFDESLRYAEDALFTNAIILKKGLIGILPQAIHYYRKRSSYTSALQQSNSDPEYFLTALDRFFSSLIDLSQEMYQEIIPYIQNIIYYDLAWRFRKDISNVLDPEQKETFLEKAVFFLQKIDDKIILRSKIHTNFVYKDLAWQLKYGHSLSEDINIAKKGVLNVKGTSLMKISSTNSCRINFVEIQNGYFILEGTISKWLFHCSKLNPYFILRVGKKQFLPEIRENANTFVKTINGDQYFQYRFRACLSIDELMPGKNRIRLGFLYKGKFYNISVNYSKFVPNRDASRWIRKTGDNGYVCTCQRMFIDVWLPHHPTLSMLRNEFYHQQWMRKEGLRKVANFRAGYLLHKCFHSKKKKIWLISDRINKADDNGEVFFKYLNSLNLSDIHPVYVISKNAERISQLKSIGKVVFFESYKYKMMFLDAEKIISSNADESGYNPLNPFGEDRKYLQDLFHQKFYFLQHGVTEKDQSSWLRRDNKNIEILCTSSRRERDSMINESYDYTEQNIALTGLARFDRLEDKREKNILIIPTWRRSIWLESGEKTETEYYEKFHETEFFHFYDALINHPRLLEKMKEKGYTGTFALHPRHAAQWVDFHDNEIFSVNKGYLDYSQAFSKAALVLTDYSGSIFDPAYLRKYIIYAQFDEEKFYEGQVYEKGYFDYKEDGFGPVCHDLESTVDALIEALDSDCVVSQKYLDRMNDFFAFNDKKNCERIYNAICEKDAAPFVPPKLSQMYLPK